MPDAVEGGVAYLERREPNWEGSIRRDWPEWLGSAKGGIDGQRSE
jgi:hypothetical protein